MPSKPHQQLVHLNVQDQYMLSERLKLAQPESRYLSYVASQTASTVNGSKDHGYVQLLRTIEDNKEAWQSEGVSRATQDVLADLVYDILQCEKKTYLPLEAYLRTHDKTLKELTEKVAHLRSHPMIFQQQ